MRHSIALLMVLCGSLALPEAGQVAAVLARHRDQVADNGAIRLSLAAAKGEYAIGEPVVVDIALQAADGEATIPVWSLSPAENYDVLVTGDNGQTPELTKRARKLLATRPIHPVGAETVAQTPSHVTIQVSDWYDLSLPGAYSIAVRRRTSAEKGRPAYVGSNSVSVKVVGVAATRRTKPAEWGPETAGLSLSLSTDQLEYKAGDDVEVTVLMRDVSDRNVDITSDKGLTSFDYVVLDEGGRALSSAREGMLPYGSSGPRSELKPGDEIRGTEFLSELFDLTTPGIYTVTATRTVPYVDREVVVESNTVTIRIK